MCTYQKVKVGAIFKQKVKVESNEHACALHKHQKKEEEIYNHTTV